jgi:hypothetical protein
MVDWIRLAPSILTALLQPTAAAAGTSGWQVPLVGTVGTVVGLYSRPGRHLTASKASASANWLVMSSKAARFLF